VFTADWLIWKNN